MLLSAAEVAVVASVGLVAGVVGGLAGVGGSLVMIPGMVLLLGYDDQAHSRHHVYMAAAMLVNVVVSLPAMLQHRRAGVVRFDLARTLLPAMIAAVLVGVVVSNRVPAEALRTGLACFILAYCGLNVFRVLRNTPDADPSQERAGTPSMLAIGSGSGLLAGILGIGGGVVMTPALQLICRVPLRQAVGTSSAVMVVSAAVGATLKLSTLHSAQGRSPSDALQLALLLAPSAALGGWLGARLNHKLNLVGIRLAITAVLGLAAIRLLT